MLGHVDAQLCTVLAREAEKRMRGFKPQNLSNTAWAFATLGLVDVQLLTALMREAERLGDFKAQGLANTAWGLAKAG